jgi:hypothetical protein
MGVIENKKDIRRCIRGYKTPQPWYMPITPNSKMPTPRKCLGQRGEDREEALHRNGASCSSGTPTRRVGDQNRRDFPLMSLMKEEL